MGRVRNMMMMGCGGANAAGGGGGGGGIVNFLGTVSDFTLNYTPGAKTFSAVPIGEADDDRLVIWAFLVTANITHAATVTIGGVSATVVMTAVDAGMTGIAYAVVPTGTTADIVYTPGSSAALEAIGGSIYTAITATPAHTDSTTIDHFYGADPQVLVTPVTIPTGGWAIAVIGGSGTDRTGVWSGASKDVRVIGTRIFETGHTIDVQLSWNLSITGFSYAGLAITAVAWGP